MLESPSEVPENITTGQPDILEDESGSSDKLNSPSAIRQFKNAGHAMVELQNNPYPIGQFQKAGLLLMMTMSPETVEESGILTDPDRLAAIDAFFNYSFNANELWDAEGSGRNALAGVVEEARQLETDARQRFNATLATMPEDKRHEIQPLIETAIQEIDTVERDIRRRMQDHTLTFDEVDEYRKTVNAINLGVIFGTTFGTDCAGGRLKPQSNQQSMAEIVTKYRWMYGTVPREQVEQLAMTLTHLVAATQLIDDWYGRQIDYLLQVPSYAMVELDQARGNEEQARLIIKQQIRHHKQRAQQLGFAAPFVEGASHTFGGLSRLIQAIPEKAYKNPGSRAEKFVRSHRFSTRDYNLIDKKLDLTPDEQASMATKLNWRFPPKPYKQPENHAR